MKYLAEFILVFPVNIGMAWWHGRLIKAGRKIGHGLWAGVFVLLLAGALLWQWDDLGPGLPRPAFILACLCARLPVFNISLNLFRRLKWDYMSPTSTSIVDKITLRLFGRNARVLWAVLIAIAITLNFFL